MKKGQPRESGYLHPGNETMSRVARESYQAGKLKDYLRTAVPQSPFYRDKFAAAGINPEEFQTLKDLASFPLTRRGELVSAQRSDPPLGGFLTQSRKRLRRLYVLPGLIFSPGERSCRDRRWAEALYACGLRRGDLALNAFSYHLWPFAFMLDESLRQLGCTTIPAGTGNHQLLLRVLQTTRAEAILGTPGFLMDLAEGAEAMGLEMENDLALKVGFVAAEMLSESLRCRLEKKLNITVRQAYGTVDVGCLGYECPARNGLHIPHEVVVEVVDPETGAPLPPGRPGEVAATHFNPLFPLVRFATGDLSVLNEAPCPCGRSSLRLVKILGRIDEATKVRGVFIHPWQLDEILSAFDPVARYQLVVKRREYRDDVDFLVELRQEGDDCEELRNRLTRALRIGLGQEVEVKIVGRGRLPERIRKIEDLRTWE